MEQALTLDVSEVIDGQKVGVRALLFLALGILVLVSDGYDLAAIGYVAPELVKEWHIAPSALVNVFSAGIFGLLLGAPLFGFVGDRFGRRKAILLGLCLFGAMSLITMAATSLPQFVALRFLTGLGLGGVIPNVLALTSENAPKRFRGMFIVIVGFGQAACLALPGLVAAGLVPRFGWPVLLLVGGILPIAMAAIGYYALPESLKYLARQGDRLRETRYLAGVLRPDLGIGDTTRFAVGSNVREGGRGSIRGLFAGGLATITPLVWITYAAGQMANFFTLTWLPILLQSMGASTAQAGFSASLFGIGGLVGGICLSFVADRLGALPVAILAFLAAPLIFIIGLPGLSIGEQELVIAAAGFCITGISFGMSVVVGTVYPTAVRAAGIGWGQAAGRAGALVAPIVGGTLLAMNFPTWQLLMAPMFVLVVGGIASTIFTVVFARRFGGYGLREFPSGDGAVLGLASPKPAE